jgi:hypothetical protein
MSGNLGVLVLVLGSLDRLKFHFGKMKVADIQIQIILAQRV